MLIWYRHAYMGAQRALFQRVFWTEHYRNARAGLISAALASRAQHWLEHSLLIAVYSPSIKVLVHLIQRV